MIELSNETLVALDRRMARVGVDPSERLDYRKWVRYYLDFCQKHGHLPREEGSLGPFLAKLAAKNQSSAGQRQAARAVRLLLGRVAGSAGGGEVASHRAASSAPGWEEGMEGRGTSVVREEDGNLRPSVVRGNSVRGRVARPDQYAGRSASWESEYRELEGAIKMRNYSPKTYAVYRMWVQKFQAFLQSKPPMELDAEDAKRFLSDLAVGHKVAGSTQNQAFNALLFFYRHVLRREFGEMDGVVRAKCRRYVPVVLSRAEVDAVIAEIDPTYRLVALLLYGCGLRLTECLELRVQCFNLESGLLTIHDGKGQKDRTVPLPERAGPEIRAQMEKVRATLRADREADFAGTFLPGQLEKKLKNAAKEFIWQWFFPATTLTRVGSERRRYHLHDTHVQGAVKRAAEAAGVPKRVSPHTFRHTFASHLLLAGYDLQTIQKLLGHSDVKTTMIYLQTVPEVTLKKARSPLDLP